jgi:hypothetical protein
MSNATLLELADRVEKASEGHCYLDAEIEATLKLYPKSYPWIANFTDCRAIQGRVQVFNDKGESSANWAPPSYTSSLDAAMTLVPEGLDWRVELCADIRCGLGAAVYKPGAAKSFPGVTLYSAATPALALTAAALRARAQQESSDADQ